MPIYDTDTDEELEIDPDCIAQSSMLNNGMSKAIEALNDMHTAMRKLDNGPLSFYLKQLSIAYLLLVTKYAPFKIGDNVLLTKTPDIGADSGWSSCKHFLVKGAVATVKKIDVNSSQRCLTYFLMFENESYISSVTHNGVKMGDIVPIDPERRHTFGFSESYLVKIK